MDEIARLFYDGSKVEARNRAEELGWEQIGSGAGRSVFRIPLAIQEGDRGGVVRDSPCVIKLAVSGMHDGLMQNQAEIGQWRGLPERVREVEPPVFVPIKDSDEGGYWLTMPEVDTEGGFGARDRLVQLGMDCDDLHGDNVGSLHGEPVILDYGYDCREANRPEETAEKVEDWLTRYVEGVRNVEIAADDDNAAVAFDPPAHIGVEGEPDTQSEIRIDTMHGIYGGAFAFGPFDVEDDDALLHPAQEIEERLSEDWFDVMIRPRVFDVDAGGKEAVFNFEIQARYPEEQWIADMVAEFYDDCVGWVEDYYDDTDHTGEILRDIAIAMEETGITETERNTGPLSSTLRFWPPRSAPGFQRPGRESRIAIDTFGFDVIHYTVGPYQEGETHYPPIPDGADSAIGTVQGQHPNMEASWRLLSNDDDPTTVDVTFTVASDQDDPDTTHLEPVEVRDLYADLALAVEMEMPSAIPKGASQETLDEFARAIDGAIESALSGK